MLIVSMKSGLCESYDLGNGDLETFAQRSTEKTWHEQVTSVSLCFNGTRVDLPIPRGFGAVTYDADVVVNGETVVAERVSASAGDSYITLTSYVGPGTGRFRLDVARVGKRRWRSSQS